MYTCMCECLLRGADTLVLTKANTPQQKFKQKNKQRCLRLIVSKRESDLTCDTVSVCD